MLLHLDFYATGVDAATLCAIKAVKRILNKAFATLGLIRITIKTSKPMAVDSKAMQIQKISVSDLFGIFDHVISLNMNERITIIHGPNGFGKTAMLRMIDGFFNSR